MVAQKVSESLGQQVVVDNRAGAGGAVGAESVAKSPPDGYTLLLATTRSTRSCRTCARTCRTTPVRDFVPVGRIATASNVLVVNNALPAQNVAELVKYAKERPGQLNYASAGIGTPAHLAGEMLTCSRHQGDARPVQGCGAGPARRDRRQRAVHHHLADRGGRAHGRGPRARDRVDRHERNPALPELPTVADTLPGYEITQSWGIVAPAGTPADVVKRLGDEFAKALANAESRTRS
jgi:tripartite-type tricarboxylate transporter receptor subunit TctC